MEGLFEKIYIALVVAFIVLLIVCFAFCFYYFQLTLLTIFLSIFCFIFGILIATIIAASFFWMRIPKSTAATELADVEDSESIADFPALQCRDDLYNEGRRIEDYNYEFGGGDSILLRSKRNLNFHDENVSATPGLLVSTTSDPQGTIPGVSESNNNSLVYPHSSVTKVSSASSILKTPVNFTDKPDEFVHNTTKNKVDYIPSFYEPHPILDAVFSHAERENMKESLGLCRKSVDITFKHFKTTSFSAEEASDLLACINNLLLDETNKQVCIQLDPEMNAYLNWLVSTGEPRQKPKLKPSKTKPTYEFLFPPTPCAKEEQGCNLSGSLNNAKIDQTTLIKKPI